MPIENSGLDIRSANQIPELKYSNARNGFIRMTSESGNSGLTSHLLTKCTEMVMQCLVNNYIYEVKNDANLKMKF